MDIPSQPVEGKRIDRYRPPHCPYPDCPDHHIPEGKRYRCIRYGYYRRKQDPHRRVPRFQCRKCNRTFSLQTFSSTYYLKRPELLLGVAALLVAGSANRQIARSLKCAHSSVNGLAARVGRHALLLQATALSLLRGLDEPVVLDHFETFVFSQEDRLAIGTAVGHRSWFCYALDPAQHRRGGRRSSRKRALRRPLPEPDPGSMVRSTKRLIRLLLSLCHGRPLELITDDAPAYRQAVRELAGEGVIHRRVYPNPKRGPGSDTAVTRERDRQMFPVDLLHKLWRHTQAHHRRETIAFARRSNAALERGFLFIVWRNFVKKVSERTGEPLTPAMQAGLTTRPLDWWQVFAKRLFPCRVRLPEGWMKIYRRGWTTPAVGKNQRHELVHAF